jgi:hypothetical protein
MIRLLVLSGVLALRAAPVLAVQAPATAAATPSAQQIAGMLVPENTWNQMLDGYASTLSKRISGALSASGKEGPKDLTSKIRSDLDETMPYARAKRLEAEALTKKFSEQELGRIASFYQSPEGQKALRELPLASREVSDELETRMSEQVPKIVQKYAPSLASKQPSDVSPGSSGTPSSPGATPPSSP